MWHFCVVLDKMGVVSLGYPLGMFGVSLGEGTTGVRRDHEPTREQHRSDIGATLRRAGKPA